MQTNESPVSEPGFLNSMCNSTSPQHRLFVQHEGTRTRGTREQNSHQVKLQLIIIVTDNKTCDKKGEAMLTPFILDTKAKEMINLSPGYLLEGHHLGKKEAWGKPAVSKRKENKSESHHCCLQQMWITPVQMGQPLGDTNTQCIHSCTYLLPIGLKAEEMQRSVWPLQEVHTERQQGSPARSWITSSLQ